MTRKYTMTEKKQKATFDMTNWEYRLEVARLLSQGWSYGQVAKYMSEKRGKSITRAAIFIIYQKIKNMSIEELEANSKK